MIAFTKAHAYGNDFLYVQAKEVEGASIAVLARELCDRHTGVGADGLIIYEVHGTDVSMRLLNADGSRAEVSGNGLRALGAVVLQDDERPDVQLTIRTEAGTRPLVRLGRDRTRQTFRGFMGEPAGLRQLPPLEIGGETVVPAVLNMGNPHSVIIGRLPDRGTFERVGAVLERHGLFPEGTNVEFAEVETPSRIRVLIWERGVGPTNSSGTGSCAALVAAAAFGGADREADVAAPGGTQRVDWRADGVYLTGWAEVLCVGKWLRPSP
jgi:diaminopimelate epimerase